MAHTWVDGEVVSATLINQYTSDMEDLKEACEEATVHEPIIQNGTWWIWNQTNQQYEDTTQKVNDNLSVTSSKTGKVTTVDVKVNNVTETTLTINDGEDGAGSGDMTKATYDSDNAVASAGGIASYVSSHAGVGDMTKAVYDSDNTVSTAGGIKAYVNGQKELFLATTSTTFQQLVDAYNDGKILVFTDNNMRMYYLTYYSTTVIMFAGVVKTVVNYATIYSSGGTWEYGYLTNQKAGEVTVNGTVYTIRTGTSGASGYLTIETE